MSEPDYEQIMQDREDERDERWLARQDRELGRVEEWLTAPPGGSGGAVEADRTPPATVCEVAPRFVAD